MNDLALVDFSPILRSEKITQWERRRILAILKTPRTAKAQVRIIERVLGCQIQDAILHRYS